MTETPATVCILKRFSGLFQDSCPKIVVRLDNDVGHARVRNAPDGSERKLLQEQPPSHPTEDRQPVSNRDFRIPDLIQGLSALYLHAEELWKFVCESGVEARFHLDSVEILGVLNHYREINLGKNGAEMLVKRECSFLSYQCGLGDDSVRSGILRIFRKFN